MPSLSRLLASIATLALMALACVGPQKTDSSSNNSGEATSTVEELPNEGGETGGAQPAAAGPQLNPVSAEEGFNVKMPGQPQVQRQKVNIPAGEVSTAAYSLQTPEGVIYSVSIADYPEKVVASRPPEAFLNEGRDGLTNQLKGTVSNEQELTLDGYPGKSYTVSSPNGEVRARNYLVGPRLYTMLVLYNPSIGAPAADDFLGSLQLVNPPPAIPRAGAAGAADAGSGDAGVGAEGAAVEATAPDAGPQDAGTAAPAKRRRTK
ncbi:hypothetical protein FJV41_08965 [Myxococcus llanfairpwllgwyngyllgogerychwyrndrobwllllantysiliogogogochensis]|uniref:Lipoprotein n=1 Tax=Myxococcus llanfairpwllgwyngyllgogerychwyrndrobwllllantysiliogogogochensis TaxID=2590453 RepID=A0A540X542_9BACT|nr:hypothetical protein [Myxococcus llanfairpwllgwyngyllgogerychwyrndrobwllllantysiliogogogochensis]TQF16365.1 hypothetical protein FJV41_08965 [Myxococcus llanfairpwllgwyngyllgogerychwyrndrobwllllantysiliogogogochensis]